MSEIARYRRRAKAHRYTDEVLEVADARTFAVRADTGTWLVTRTTDGPGWCNCPAEGRCSHQLAVELAIARADPQPAPDDPFEGLNIPT